MKKIGIYTLQTENYGNKLQNYAVQCIIKKIGYYPKTFSRNIYFRRTKNNFPIITFRLAKKFVRDIVKKDRTVGFDKFCYYFLDYAPLDEFICNDSIQLKAYKYRAIVAGSDQIWNTEFPDINVNSFLPFPHPRKIAFSASFGVDSIPYDKKIVDCLNDFKAISVREEAGAKIVKELTGRDATVLVDPTMLLTKEEWRKVSKKPRGAKEGYVLTYFLSLKCAAAKDKLEEIQNGREVYELLNDTDKVAGTAGPSEFLWLFDHADLILTDSFHACVFSLLFNKPFIVYDRNWNGSNMNSRLETLLSKFHIERKYAGSGLENDIWEHDYEEGYKQLEIEREKAIDFLKKALED